MHLFESKKKSLDYFYFKKIERDGDLKRDKPNSSMHPYRTRLQAKKQREAQELRTAEIEAAKMRRLIAEKAEATVAPSCPPLKAAPSCPPLNEEMKNDVRFIRSRLDLIPRADSALERTEISIEIFDYLADHPLLIKTHERFHNVIEQKIIEFQMAIQMERQELKSGPSNRTMYEWKQQAKILGMFDILEELIRRVKVHL